MNTIRPVMQRRANKLNSYKNIKNMTSQILVENINYEATNIQTFTTEVLENSNDFSFSKFQNEDYMNKIRKRFLEKLRQNKSLNEELSSD